MKQTLLCWHCGSELRDVILPMSRRQECQHCGADQHVCKLCENYNPRVADACTEDRAEVVANKERANFCDYFLPRANAYQTPVSPQADRAAAKLAELFGDELPAETREQHAEEKSKADAARDASENLFKKD